MYLEVSSLTLQVLLNQVLAISHSALINFMRDQFPTQPGQRPVTTPHGYINQRLQIQFGTPDDERCAARNMLSLQ